MNIKSIIASILITVAGIGAYHYTSSNSTQAYVDTAQMMAKYKGMEKVQQEIEAKTKILYANVDTLAMEIQLEIKAYEKERSSMSERERKAKEELIGHKQQQFMGYKEATQKRAAEEQQVITNKALLKINDVIKEYGKSHNYTIIFGTTGGNIVYADDAINITDEIVEILNKGLDEEN